MTITKYAGMSKSILAIAACAWVLAGCGHPAGNAAASAPTPTVAASYAATSGTHASNAPAAADDDEAAEPDHVDPGNGLQWDSQQHQLIPLTADDLKLYLDVMHAAAERVRQPTPRDLDAMRQYQAHQVAVEAAAKADQPAQQAAVASVNQSYAAIMAAAKSGDGDALHKAELQAQKNANAMGASTANITAVPALDPATQELGSDLSLHDADLVIVNERHLSLGRYQWVKGIVEGIVVPPSLRANASCGGGDCGVPEVRTPEQIRYAAQLDRVTAKNKQLLTPHQGEIEGVETTVYGSHP